MEKNEIILMFGMIFGLLLVIFGLFIVNIPNGIKLMLIGLFVMLIFYCVYCFIDVDKYKKQKNQELKNKAESLIEYLDKVIGEPK